MNRLYNRNKLKVDRIINLSKLSYQYVALKLYFVNGCLNVRNASGRNVLHKVPIVNLCKSDGNEFKVDTIV